MRGPLNIEPINLRIAGRGNILSIEYLDNPTPPITVINNRLHSIIYPDGTVTATFMQGSAGVGKAFPRTYWANITINGQGYADFEDWKFFYTRVTTSLIGL